ncbi:MAG: radical SAM protein, partial [Chromatiales bacterium]
MDTRSAHHLAFGPVPSRRLGRSLGINNVPTKTCDYTCVYCQVGPTTLKIVEPRPFFSPEEIREAVRARVEGVRAAGGGIDYLTFVPDGEPTLDARLGESIEALRPLGIPVAIITNATLLSRGAVREAVAKADLVSLKVDTVDEDAWRRINLPHHDLDLGVILDGIRRLASAYRGRLITDTMLIAGINDSERLLAG